MILASITVIKNLPRSGMNGVMIMVRWIRSLHSCFVFLIGFVLFRSGTSVLHKIVWYALSLQFSVEATYTYGEFLFFSTAFTSDL